MPLVAVLHISLSVMNRKIKKLFRDPKAYFYDYFRKKVRNQPNSMVSHAVRAALAIAKTDLGYGMEIRRHLKSCDMDLAERICLEGMKVVPRSIRPFALYAEVSMRRGDFKEATKRWKEVVERFPDKVEGYAREVRAYIGLNDMEHAERLCLAGMERMPSELWPYREYAEISMLRKDWTEAASRWSKLREKFPHKIEGYMRAAQACIETEDYPEAESLCRTTLVLFPDDIWPYQLLAEVSMRQKEFSEAVNRWQIVRERFPQKTGGYVRASVAHCTLNEYKAAEDLCRMCMEAVPDDIAGFVEFAEISMRKEEYREASNRWEIVRDKFPENPAGYMGGGRACMELQDYDKSENICLQGLQAIGDSVKSKGILYFLIEVYLKQTGKAKKCIDLIFNIEQSYSETITDRKYYDTLGKVLFFLLGRDKEAVNGSNTNFILHRLLKEPLSLNSDRLGLAYALYYPSMLSRYSDVRELLNTHIDTYIQEEHNTSPMAVLVSSLSSDDDRLNAYLQIIRNSCYHSVQLCLFQPQNVNMLHKACNVIIEGDEWQSLDPFMLYEFTRAVVFTDLKNGDSFISKIYEINKDNSYPVSDPIGFLCHRHKRRQELLKYVSDKLSDEHNRLNIAICISGQLRGYKGNLKSLVHSLGLEHHKYRVFVHTWANIGRHFPPAGHASRSFSVEFSKAYYECFINIPNLKGYIKRQYPALYSLLVSSPKATVETLEEEYHTHDIVIDDEDSKPFSSWTNQEKMHYKIYAAHQLALESGERFDLMVRIRPDLNRICDDPINLIEVYNQSKANLSLFTDSGLHIAHAPKDYWIDDMFAIGIPETMNIFSNTYNDFNWHKKHNTYLHTKQLTGHVTITHNVFFNGVSVEKLDQKPIRTVKESEKININAVHEAINKDAAQRQMTDEDKRLLAACKKDILSLQ